MILKEENNSIVIQPQGRLDEQGGLALQQRLNAINPKKHQVWVIDMAQVDFMDSSGLVSLVTGLKTARQHQCHLVICNLGVPVRLIFEITQLDRVFEIFDSYDLVRASLQRRQVPVTTRNSELAVA